MCRIATQTPPRITYPGFLPLENPSFKKTRNKIVECDITFFAFIAIAGSAAIKLSPIHQFYRIDNSYLSIAVVSSIFLKIFFSLKPKISIIISEKGVEVKVEFLPFIKPHDVYFKPAKGKEMILAKRQEGSSALVVRKERFSNGCYDLVVKGQKLGKLSVQNGQVKFVN